MRAADIGGGLMEAQALVADECCLGRGNDDCEREGIRRDDVAGLDFGPVR